jgi:uncharacterized protein (DUF4213/DUF364 family)
MIIEQTYNLLKTKYKDLIDGLFIEDVRIGSYITAVKLSDGSIGTASTLEEENPFCTKNERDFGSFTPLKIKGQKITDLFLTEKDTKLISSLRTASLNAISSKIISSGKYKVVENCDPIRLIDFNEDKTVTIVGAFQSYIERISMNGSRLFVLELDESALRPEQKRFYVPASDYKKVISVSDIVIITGQTLVNKTIDDLLDSVSPGTQVVITGPSSSLIPDILFENKVSIIGAVRITKPEMVFDIVGQAGLGYHLFEYCAMKICVVKE